MTQDGPHATDELTPRTPMVAAIDLGSNSFHMIVAKVEQGEIRAVERLGQKVQLAEGLNASGELCDAAMERGYKCLQQFAQFLTAYPFHAVRIVGTNALRNAKNSGQFVERAQQILGYPIEIIAGREEARLIYLGVAHTQADDCDRRLVMDIGGGSTEFVIGERFEPKLMESLRMGCVEYAERYFPNDELSVSRFQSAYYAARLELLNIENTYKSMGWSDAIGSSGTIRAVVNILAANGEDELINREKLEELSEKVLSVDRLSKLRLPSLKGDRQGVFPAGLAILIAAFDALDLKTMRYSDGALREGVLHDLMGRDQHEDVRARTIKALMMRYHVDAEQTHRTKTYAKHSFDQVASRWELNDADWNMLSWAVSVSKIGMDISHSQYHRHSAYLIENSDLMGFGQEEQEQLALIVLGHRRSLTRMFGYEFAKKMSRRLIRLIILLRLANVLSRGHSEEQPPFSVSVKGEKILVSFDKDWLVAHPLTGAEIDEERWYLSKVGYQLDIQP